MKIRYFDCGAVETINPNTNHRWCVNKSLVYAKDSSGHEICITEKMLKEFQHLLNLEKKSINNQLKQKKINTELRKQLRRDLKEYRRQLTDIKTAHISGWYPMEEEDNEDNI